MNNKYNYLDLFINFNVDPHIVGISNIIKNLKRLKIKRLIVYRINIIDLTCIFVSIFIYLIFSNIYIIINRLNIIL